MAVPEALRRSTAEFEAICGALLELASAFGEPHMWTADWMLPQLLGQADGSSVSAIFQALQQQQGWTTQLAAQALLGTNPLNMLKKAK